MRKTLKPHEVTKRIDQLIEQDQVRLITLKRPKNNQNRFTSEQWKQLPESIQYRNIRYRLTGRNEVITIVTTLTDSGRFSAEDIAELYGLRWDVETDISSWKTTMGFCDLRCRTLESLDREIAVGVLSYNLVRSLINDAAAVLQIHTRQVSFSRSRDAAYWDRWRESIRRLGK